MADETKQGFSDVFKLESMDSDKLIDLAKICESAERFDDMALVMRQIVQKVQSKLDVEERNMLSVAYKNVVGNLRASWRSVKADTDAGKGTNGDGETLKGDYQSYIEGLIKMKCESVIALVEQGLISSEVSEYCAMDKSNPDRASKLAAIQENSDDAENQTFYLKMCADYYRYLAEVTPTNDGKQSEPAKNAKGKYDIALSIAKALAPTHPTRLGLSLNAAVCYYEVNHNPTAACDLAKTAFDEAISQLDSLSDSTYKDSTLIMQLLRDNLTIWTSENGATENAED